MKKKLIFLSITLLFSISAFSQNALTDSLIAYYPFSGNANDVGGNNNNGTVIGAALTTDRFGNANSAYSFNGTTDYIRVKANAKLQPTTFPFSISAWVKANTTVPNNGQADIFDNNLSPDVYAGIAFYISYADGAVLGVTYSNGGAPGPDSRRTKTGTIPLNDNQWHFVSAVVRGYADMDLYVDCRYDTAATYSGTATTFFYNPDSSAIMGMTMTNNTPGFYEGSIDEVRFYNRALTQTDLQYIHSYPKPVDLWLKLPMDSIACLGAEVTIIAPDTTNDLDFLWSTGSNNGSITVNQTGSYGLQEFNGCSYISDTMKVTFESCAGIEQISAGGTFNLTYNTDNNSVMIQNLTSGQNNLLINICNALGQKIQADDIVKTYGQSVYRYALPENLPTGIYLVNARLGNESKSLKIIQ